MSALKCRRMLAVINKMADFPTKIYNPRTIQNVSGHTYTPSRKTRFYAEDLNFLADEVVAIEELFINYGLTTNITVLTALPAVFSTLHFENGLLVDIT
jgi:hypothetical protein